MDPIQGAITELLKLREKRATEIQKIDDAIDVLMKITDAEPKRKTAKISTPPKAQTPQARKSGRRGGKSHPFSQYKGVSIAKPRINGTRMFQASYVVNGKNRYLGRFESEEAAAAVAAEARGEKERAAELRAIAEQKENHPDRPLDRGGPRIHRGSSHLNHEPKTPKAAKPQSEKKSDPEQMQIWTCKVCNLEFKAKKKPLMCPGCNRTNLPGRPMTEEEAAE